MREKFIKFVIYLVIISSVFFTINLCTTSSEGSTSWKASGRNGAIATGGPEAAEAAVDIMKAGGNAVDAAAAALLVLSVIDSQNYCFGGEVPIIVYDPNRKVVEVIAGQGAAPRKATLEYFKKRGGIPQKNDPATAAVPGSPGAILTALARYGTMRFAEVAQPMLRLLDKGQKPWHLDLARTVRKMIESEVRADDLLRGLRLARDCFYRGQIARDLDAWSRKNGGLIRYTDLATHITRIEEPVSVQYKDYKVHKCGLWTQGPYLLETLNLLEEDFELHSMERNSPDYIHLVTEVMKLGLADRDTYYGDPLFVDVPLNRLLSDAYAEIRRPLIDMKQASLKQRPGDPRRKKPLLSMSPKKYRGRESINKDTTTCVVADRAGYVVAATPSGWGGKLAGETGVILGSRLRSFNTWKGHPNQIKPGKRPRITLTPTLVMKEGKPVLAVSVAGGDRQDQVTIQLLLNYMEFGLDPANSVSSPRFGTGQLIGSFNQPPPERGKLFINEVFGSKVIKVLKRRGHRIGIIDQPFGYPVVLSIDPESGSIRAAGDPEAGRYVLAY